MRALAEFLGDLDWVVIGSDADPSGIQNWAMTRSIPIIPIESRPKCDVVIRSAAVPVEMLSEVPVPNWTYPEVLSCLSTVTPTLAIAGTHGKTTVATLTAAALGESSRLVGGVGVHDGRSGRFQSSSKSPIVIEACEYRDHFLQLQPSAACILNAEWDHPDVYSDLEAVENSFQRFLGQLPSRAACVVNKQVADRISDGSRQYVTFGTEAKADYWPRDVRSTGCGVAFDLMHDGAAETEIAVDCLAPEFVLNAVAAAAIAIEVGVAPEKVAAGIANYRGVERRFSVNTIGDTVFVDDYAHHPTAVRKSVDAVEGRWPDRPVIVVFEPHQSARLRAFEEEFAAALDSVAEVFIAPIFAAREAEPQFGATLGLANRLGSHAVCCDSLDQVAARLETRLIQQPRSVVLLLGAGKIGRILDERLAHERRQ